MTPAEALRAVEDLRKGIPPEGFVRHFTVGRRSEIEQLGRVLKDGTGTALLLRANPGAGKSHLLKFIRESALEAGYVVSWVTLDCRSGVRFNRMDQIFGYVCRGIEIPSALGEKGIRPFLECVCRRIEEAKADGKRNGLWARVTSGWKWDFSDELESSGFYVGLRAWATGKAAAQDLVENWFYNSWDYRGQRKVLYLGLVEGLRKFFREPRREWQFYADNVFVFSDQDYQQSWAALRDMHRAAVECGSRGMVVLFDEYEDVITNLNRIDHKEKAFWNLFEFYSGKKFKGMSMFAVTPEFAEKCKTVLLEKGRYDYDYSRFETLPTFAMSPLKTAELEELARKIMAAHGLAYNWAPGEKISDTSLRAIVSKAAAVRVEDRARHTIKEVVKAFDRKYDEES